MNRNFGSSRTVPGFVADIDVVDYSEHAIASGNEATAVAYVETRGRDGDLKWGVGMHGSITTASFRAVMSALSRQRRDLHPVDRHEP